MKKRTVLDGRYELGKPLGQGGMAMVRLATDLRLGRPVAVKLLRADRLADPTFLERFRREARAAGSLNHASIVAVYDTGEAEDAGEGTPAPYIVMEYVEGNTVRALLRSRRQITPERALDIADGVLAALEHSHQAGIVHRDIKPGNVMLTPAGVVKVMDFGIARALESGQTITKTSAMIGTAQYISPEQVRGGAVDVRSDLYSTGCLLYEMLTGRPPFAGDSAIAVAYQHVRETAPPPSTLNAAVPPEADAIVGKALEKNPNDRYQSAVEMRADVLRALGNASAFSGPSVAASAGGARVDEQDTIVGNVDLAALGAALDPDVDPDLDADLDGGSSTERTLVEIDWDGERDAATTGGDPAEPRLTPVQRRRLMYAGMAMLVLVVIGGAGTLFAVLLSAAGLGPIAERENLVDTPSQTTSRSASPSPTQSGPARVVRDDEQPRRTQSPTPTLTQSPTPTQQPTPTQRPTPTTKPTEPEPTEPEQSEPAPTTTPKQPPPTTPPVTPPSTPPAVYLA